MIEETRTKESEKRFKSIEAVFEDRLGIPFPEKPEDLPLEILLKPNVFGGLIEAVLAQETEDKFSEDGLAKERSQFLGILNMDGTLRDTKVFLGLPIRTKDALAELKRWFQPLFGQKIKPLVYWHTHTEKADSPFPTESDVAQRLGEDRKCSIYLHASPTEITAIVQTKKAYPKSIPVSTMQKGFNFYDQVVKIYNSSDTQPKLDALAKFLEEQGYAIYTWKKPNQVKTVKDGVDSGCFLSGIKMDKI